MLNIEFQISGMILIILVFIFFTRLPRLNLRTTRAFGFMLPVCALTVFLDVASVVCICNADFVPDSVVKAVCKAYLVVLMSFSVVNFDYLCADYVADEKTYIKMNRIARTIFFVLIAAMLFLPIEYVCEDEGRIVYSTGAFTVASYGMYAISFITFITITITKRHHLNTRRNLSVWVWLLSFLVAAVIQFFNSNLLLVTFAECVDILILFLMIENPEFYLDKSSGFFHINAMPRYINEVYADKNCYIINTRYNVSEIDFFETVQNSVNFVGNGEIYLIFSDKESYDTELRRISEEMNKRSIYACEDKSIISDAEELQSVFKRMQELKRAGKATNYHNAFDNVYTITGEVISLFDERDAAKELVVQAISEKNGYTIEPFFQPIYSIETGKFSSAEALARIRDKDGQIIPPMKFIPIAEENGSIIELGKIMFEKVCEIISKNDDIGLKYIEVNLSVVQGADKHLAEDVFSTMEKYSIASDRINLEITETASIQGREQLLVNMHKMIKKGLNFSLDDFGTGQSNLDYMTVMPVNLVKFDRMITQSYFVLDKTKNIMTSAVQMIHNMGMKVVIEGIETTEQFEEMKELGVDYIQGYYFSKPLPKDEFVAFMKEHNFKND